MSIIIDDGFDAIRNKCVALDHKRLFFSVFCGLPGEYDRVMEIHRSRKDTFPFRGGLLPLYHLYRAKWRTLKVNESFGNVSYEDFGHLGSGNGAEIDSDGGFHPKLRCKKEQRPVPKVRRPTGNGSSTQKDATRSPARRKRNSAAKNPCKNKEIYDRILLWDPKGSKRERNTDNKCVQIFLRGNGCLHGPFYEY